MEKPELVIGLFGFGVVGEGLYHVLENSKTVNARIKQICIRNPEKERSLPADFFTTEASKVLEDNEINLFVELIDDPVEAYNIAKTVLQSSRRIVSGNKKMLAFHLPELIELQQKFNGTLLYEASACGSIPIIRNLEEYYDNDLMTSVTGILNGSSNFILTKLFKSGTDYAAALKEAQNLGFAESDPSADVDGFDALYKLVIIATHAIGTWVHPEKLFHIGIRNISRDDIRFAIEKGFKIKLIAKLVKLGKEKFSLFVMPCLTGPENYVYNVEDEYNGVIIEGQYYDKQFMFGKGAGAYPTGSAVLSDITACEHAYSYEYKKIKYFRKLSYSEDLKLKIYLRYENLIDLSHFSFETISEKYTSQHYNFVIGEIRLSELVRLKNIILKLNVFVAFYEEEV